MPRLLAPAKTKFLAVSPYAQAEVYGGAGFIVVSRRRGRIVVGRRRWRRIIVARRGRIVVGRRRLVVAGTGETQAEGERAAVVVTMVRLCRRGDGRERQEGDECGAELSQPAPLPIRSGHD